MFVPGQSRRCDRAPITSGLPRLAGIFRARRHVSNVQQETLPRQRTGFYYSASAYCQDAGLRGDGDYAHDGSAPKRKLENKSHARILTDFIRGTYVLRQRGRLGADRRPNHR